MRRHEREITEFGPLVDILARSDYMTLSFADGNTPYAVPVNFGFEADEDARRVVLYVHGAREGTKLDFIRRNPRTAFAAVADAEPAPGAVPCAWSEYYESVCGTGEAHLVEDEAEKRAALMCILRKHGYTGSADFPDAALATVCVIRIDVSEITGKAHVKGAPARR